MNPSLATLKEAVQIHEEIASLEARLEKILGGVIQFPLTEPAPAKRGRKKLSASSRANMAAAAKARWAKIKRTSSVEEPVKKKGGMSAAGRARIAAAQRARWAKVKGTIYS